MGLLICFCCGRQREVKPIKKGVKYTCGNCGAKRVRIIRSKAYANYIAWTDKEGMDAEKARHELYGALRGYAERRGYKQGWISHKFKEITGRWPNGESVESGTAGGNQLLRWIREQNKAFAKGKRESELASVGNRVPMRRVNNVDDTSPLMTDDDWGVKL